jgi:hypothetical protein
MRRSVTDVASQVRRSSPIGPECPTERVARHRCASARPDRWRRRSTPYERAARACRAASCPTQRGDSNHPAWRAARCACCCRSWSSSSRSPRVVTPPRSARARTVATSTCRSGASPSCPHANLPARPRSPPGMPGYAATPRCGPFAASSYPRSQVAPGLEARRSSPPRLLQHLEHNDRDTTLRSTRRCTRGRLLPGLLSASLEKCAVHALALALEHVHFGERGGVEVRRGDRALGSLAIVHEGRQGSTAAGRSRPGEIPTGVAPRPR